MNPFIIRHLQPNPAEFWRDRAAHWPKMVPPGYVFLGEALERVGRAIHTEAWTGEEMITPAVAMLPSSPSLATMDQLEEASRSIGEASGFAARRTASIRGPGIFGASRPRPIFYPFVMKTDFTTEEWVLALERRHALVQHSNAAAERRISVQLAIAQACLSGELEFALRQPKSGEMLVGEPSRWNVDDMVWPRYFDRCEMSERAGDDDGQMLRVFVADAGLGRLIRSMTAVTNTAGGTAGLETRVREFLTDLMRNEPGSPVPNDRLRAVVTERFGAVGTKMFARAKANAMADANAPAWGRAGKRGQAGRRDLQG